MDVSPTWRPLGILVGDRLTSVDDQALYLHSLATEMATPGGGRHRVPPGDGGPSGGGGGEGRVRQRLCYEGGEEQLPSVQAAMPPLASSRRSCTSAGQSSCEDPLSHYASDAAG